MNSGSGAERRAELALLVLKQFRLIYGSVKQHFRNVEEACGVSGSHLWVLQEIGRNAGIGVSALAKRISIHQSTCSQLVDKLEHMGLVEKTRSQEDRRRVGLQLLPEGERILNLAPGPAEGILPEALAALSQPTLQTLNANLTDLIRNLHARDERFADRPLADL